MGTKSNKKQLPNPVLNKRLALKKMDEAYNSKERLRVRERDRISQAKRYRENDIEYLKTKKRHP